ncbi:MAG: preprotein translocase subunit SecG [Planctomycetaceae bacterium]
MLEIITMLLLGIVGALMIILILLQRGRGGGLAGAFGGAGGQSAFGTKAGDVFTKITVIFAVIWVALACANILLLRHNAAGNFGGGQKAIADEPALSSSTDDKEGTGKDNVGKDDATDGSAIIPDLPDLSPPKSESSKAETESETKADVPESSDAKTPADAPAETPETKAETENK